MPGLLELPNELLLDITSTLAESSAVAPHAALASLCLTNRRLKDVAQPVLFEAPRLSLLRRADPLRRWWQFARTVLEKPKLASRVKELSLEALAYADHSEEIASLRFDIERCSAIKSTVNQTLGSQMFIHRLASLLISPLSKLEHLHLHLTSKANLSIMCLIRSCSTKNPSHASKLKGLYVEPIGRYEVHEVVENHKHVFFSPSLHVVHIKSYTLFEQFFKSTKLQPNSLGLMELHLRGCHIDLATLEPWIEACTNLKAFTFSADTGDRRPTVPQTFRQLTPMRLLKALRSCTRTLERLDADFRGVSLWDGPTEPDLNADFACESFHEFTRLQHLRVEAVRFRDVNILPPSLKTLTIFGNDLAMLARRYYTDFVDPMRETCPRLEKIRLQYGYMGEAEMQSTLATFEWTNQENRHKNGPEMIIETESSS
jgi:hypothetical protein